MTREKASKILQGLKMLSETERCEIALDMAISALSENKGDLISRQAVLDLKQTFTDNAGYETEYVDVEDIKELPSISSVDNKGEWIESTTVFCGRKFFCIECSCCKKKQELHFKFCPNCGADMRGNVESFYDRMTEELGEDWDVPLE